MYRTIDLNDVDFNIYDAPIGVSVSGGADSALVLFLLMKYCKNHITIFSTDTSLIPHRGVIAKNIVNKCSELTGNNNYVHIIDKIEEHPTQHNIFKEPMKYQEDGFIDIIYTGLTSNPDVELKYDDTKISSRNRESKSKDTLDDNNFYAPFINHDKKKIAEIYDKFNLLDSLFPLTYSCVNSKTIIHCDNCWWCEERKWAFKRL